MVATLGTEAQVVTITLDLLLERKQRIEQVVVIHTGGEAIRLAVDRLAAEFNAGVYAGVGMRAVAVTGPGGIVEDFRTEWEVSELLPTLYREVGAVKRTGGLVHLCVSGGRKVMAVGGMVVAQLLFGEDDRLWHLLSEGWQPGGKRNMHLGATDQARLVPIPVLRWTDSVMTLRGLAELADPLEAIRRQATLAKSETMRRRREFVERWLTPAEREVSMLACRGFDNAAIAHRLQKSERTVANQLTGVYAKLGQWLDFPQRLPDRSTLISELLPYVALNDEANRK
ncbi:MAG: CRISPR-associated protein Csx14 [Chloroflexi bacterium]|nr:CRISPR-associated protein Csx14 [Chloroflexota bacterium]